MTSLAPPPRPTLPRHPPAGQGPRRTLPPVRGRSRILIALAALGLLLSYLSAWYLRFDLSTLVAGAEDVLNLLQRMLPPEVVQPRRTLDLVVETVLMAVVGTVLAAALSIPLAFLAARTTTPHPWVRTAASAVITACRAVPDLVFAIIFVRAMGLGVLPGVLALAAHSIGMLGKLFADAIDDADQGPREAVRTTGTGAVRELLNGIVPQVVPSWIGTFVYRIDINLRISVVLGFVGAGGIGFALQSALRGLQYDRALAMVLAILVVLIVLEVAAAGIRRALLVPSDQPRRERALRWGLGGLLTALTLTGVVLLDLNPWRVITSVPSVFEVSMRLLPPDFTTLGPRLWESVLQTLAIGLLATAGGLVLSIPLGVLAARNVAPHPVVAWAARLLVLAERSVPELILAVVFVAAVGLGPVAGVCALGLGSIGFLGKLVADAVEEVDPGPSEAIRAVGGGWWKVLFSAVLPQVTPRLLSSSLYLLDVNIRHSTVLGIVGAGGIGFLLYESVRTLEFEVVGAIVIIIFVIVYAIERLSGWIRTQVS